MFNPDLIQNGQGPRVAFLAKADAKIIAEVLVAFANTEGGTIVIGVTEDGKASAAKLDGDIIQKALRNAEELYNPTVVLDRWEEVQVTEAKPEVDGDEVIDDDDDALLAMASFKPSVGEKATQQALISEDAPTIAVKGDADITEKPTTDSKIIVDEKPAPVASATTLIPDNSKINRTIFTVYTVRVPRSIELHALSDGRVLIRSGAKNRPLGGQEILRLASAKSTGDFESETVPGATRDDFSRKMIDEYLEKRAERTKRPFNGKIEELLQEIGAVTPDGKPTMMGVLLFTEYPQQWLPQSSVVFAKFVGSTPRGESGLAGYTRREELTGPLPRLIEMAWNLIWSEMAVSAVVKGLEREEKTEYPAFAVREAIVNSICHRDYRLRGRRIEIRMYSDRLEVISPGGLPGFITVENIKEEHFSRNPRVVNGLFQWGYIEELGLGIDRMLEVMEQAGHRPPNFDARPYSFAVTLYNAREKTRPPEWTRNTNYRQARALQYIKEHGSITNREYRNLCQGISAETLRLDLVDMVDKGILMKVGSKKGTHYIMK
jgi:ATP-dependent DNA helicase RecG